MNNLGNARKNLLGIPNKANKYYDKNIKINLHDKNDSHALLANLVKEKSRCLDVGCSVGYIGELLKAEKNCEIYGIEIDKEAIAMAKMKKVYKEIFNFSISNYNSQIYQKFFSSNLKFDYIIFADILEHLEEPYQILYNFSKKLNKNGKILISIPNIAHMDISKNLIERKFNYNKMGLLDNTHIRFFTKSSFIDMIKNINEQFKTNLQIVKINNTKVIPSYINSYPNLYKILNQDNELCTLQYIFEISKDEKLTKEIKLKEFHFYDEIEKNISERNSFLEKILEQERIIKNYEKDLEKQKKKIKNLSDMKEEKNQQLLVTQQQLKDLSIVMEEMLNSKSWKITKPLRSFKNILLKK